MIYTVVGAIVAICILACSISYIVRKKKKGVKCIGCPMAGSGGCNCKLNR